MVYKMPVKQGTFERGDSGVGKVRFSKDGNKVQIKISVPSGKDEFVEKTYQLDKDDCPDNIDLARNAKEWSLQMSSQGDRLMSFRPVSGAFVGKTLEFASKENEESTPKSKDVDFVKDGKHIKYTYEYFTVILEIQEPEKFKGITVPLVMHYNLGEFIDDGKSVIGFSMGGKYTEQLKEYMIVSGILDEKYHPMEYKDNILPDFQRIALHEDRPFQFTMKESWIVPGSLIPYDSPDEEDLPFDLDPAEMDDRIEKVTNGDSLFEDDKGDLFEDDEEMDFEPEETEV